MFPSTRPMDAADSLPAQPVHTALSSLSPSLLQDLLRFETSASPQRALLEVLAACVRHTQPLAITLGAPGQSLLVISVFPLDRQVHCPVPLTAILTGGLAALQVVEVQPARWRAPGSTDAHRIDRPECYTRWARCSGPWRCAVNGRPCCPNWLARLPTGYHPASA